MGFPRLSGHALLVHTASRDQASSSAIARAGHCAAPAASSVGIWGWGEKRTLLQLPHKFIQDLPYPSIFSSSLCPVVPPRLGLLLKIVAEWAEVSNILIQFHVFGPIDFFSVKLHIMISI